MAKPIPFVPQPETPLERVQASVSDSASALEESLKLLQELHEHGMLDVLIKAVRGGEALITGPLQLLGGKSAIAVQHNLLELVRIVERLDPREVRILGEALSAGMAEGARNVTAGKGLGLGDLLGLLRDREVQLALGALFGILKGMGRAMREAREETSETGHRQEVGRGAR